MSRFLIFSIFLLPLSLFAQNDLQIQLPLNNLGGKVPFDAFGVNVERMFYRILDSNGHIPDEILNDMLASEDMVYRWPGGATANFYHFFEGTSKGYGLIREEVDAQDHPMRCNLPKGNAYCMSFEATTPRNYIYDLLDYADVYYQKFHKKKRVVWLPNIFTFYLNNKDEIPKLNSISSIEEAQQLMLQGGISADFYKRIKDIADVYQILNNHPTIQLEGIEYGNELYFHEPATGEKYNVVNNALMWLINNEQYTTSVRKHISLYKSIITFFNKALFDSNPHLEKAVPTGIIFYTGGMANMDRLWNEGIRDSILPLVDGVIHHFYFKSGMNVPRIDPEISEDPDQAANLSQIKTLADDFIHNRIPAVDDKFDKFFHLKENGKKIWVTEFNTDHVIKQGYYSEWQNTFFHSYYQLEAFISFIDNQHGDLVKYAFPHLFISHLYDFDYGAYAAQTNLDGTYQKIKRTTYATYNLIGNLSKMDLQRTNATVTNSKNLQRSDLFTKVYFSPNLDSGSKIKGNIVIIYTNKSGQPIQFNPNRDINIPVDSGQHAVLHNYQLEHFDADHIYTSNGFTLYHQTGIDEGENILPLITEHISPTVTHIIPGYSGGFFSIPVEIRNDSDIYTFTLQYSAGSGGTIQGDTIQTVNEFKNGTEVQAIPNQGYVFAGWSDGVTENPRIDQSVTQDIQVEAIFTLPTGIKEIQKIVSRIYPNPVTHQLNIEFENNQSYTYSIVNLQGQTIDSGQLQGKVGQLDFSSLPATSYILLLQDLNGNSYFYKLIKN